MHDSCSCKTAWHGRCLEQAAPCMTVLVLLHLLSLTAALPSRDPELVPLPQPLLPDTAPAAMPATAPSLTDPPSPIRMQIPAQSGVSPSSSAISTPASPSPSLGSTEAAGQALSPEGMGPAGFDTPTDASDPQQYRQLCNPSSLTDPHYPHIPDCPHVQNFSVGVGLDDRRGEF